jgi:hypothetical protein
MPLTPTIALQVNQFATIDVADYMADGQTLDTSEVVVTGLSVGSSLVVVHAPGVEVSRAILIPVEVSPAANLSRVEVVLISGPFQS